MLTYNSPNKAELMEMHGGVLAEGSAAASGEAVFSFSVSDRRDFFIRSAAQHDGYEYHGTDFTAHFGERSACGAERVFRTRFQNVVQIGFIRKQPF